MRGEYRARLLLGRIRSLVDAIRMRMERVKTRVVLPILLSNPLQSRLVALMAKTGIGTEQALRHGAIPLPVHFYSPVPDIDDLRSRNVWAARSALGGVDFAPERQLALLHELGSAYGSECDWPAKPTEDGRFFSENGSFSFGCAASTHCLIRSYKPRRVIEIGSGRSSQVIAAALAANEREQDAQAQYTIVDPYPSVLLGAIADPKPQVIAEKAEVIDMAMFDALESSDILFVDSGHVVRTGSDVNYLILDVLPRLKPGCVVHFHDIGLPFEYPETYATNPSFRVLWTEAYLLQAFLAFNHSYEVLLGMAYLMSSHGAEIRQAFPHFDPAEAAAVSGSFWIRRTA